MIRRVLFDFLCWIARRSPARYTGRHIWPFPVSVLGLGFVAACSQPDARLKMSLRESKEHITLHGQDVERLKSLQKLIFLTRDDVAAVKDRLGPKTNTEPLQEQITLIGNDMATVKDRLGPKPNTNTEPLQEQITLISNDMATVKVRLGPMTQPEPLQAQITLTRSELDDLKIRIERIEGAHACLDELMAPFQKELGTDKLSQIRVIEMLLEKLKKEGSSPGEDSGGT